MFAVIEQPTSVVIPVLHRYVQKGELFCVYEGDTDEEVPEGQVVLSENGTKEGPYFFFSRTRVVLED
jgi:hypothetical protein